MIIRDNFMHPFLITKHSFTLIIVYKKNTTIPMVYSGISNPMPEPEGLGTMCPAPPNGGRIPGIGPGYRKRHGPKCTMVKRMNLRLKNHACHLQRFILRFVSQL